jgi:hypothetical protein
MIKTDRLKKQKEYKKERQCIRTIKIKERAVSLLNTEFDTALLYLFSSYNLLLLGGAFP